jgi:hypothetical protein
MWWCSPISLPAGVIDEMERSFNSSMTSAGSDIGEYYQML